MAFPSLSTASCISDLPEKAFHPDSSLRFPKKAFGKANPSGVFQNLALVSGPLVPREVLNVKWCHSATRKT